MNNALYCLDSIHSLILDFSLAPTLMYYAYIPIFLLVLVFGFFIFIKDRRTNAKLFFLLSISICFWILLQVLNWIAVPVSLVAFSWQLIFIVDCIIYVLSFYFVYLYCYNKFPGFGVNILVMLPCFIILLLLPSPANFLAFDISACENVDGWGWLFSYAYQLILLIVIVVMTYLKNRNVQTYRTSYNLVSLSIVIFLSIFLTTNFFGDFISVYEINLIGPVGILLMVVIIAITIAEYKLFHIKLIIPQILVGLLFFLNFAVLFIRKIVNVRIVTVITIGLVSIIGWILVRSVKKVDAQREQLAFANAEQESLMHFITHQIKGFFTKSRNIFETINDDTDSFSPTTSRLIVEGLRSDKEGIELVENILNAANLKSGKIKYINTEFDLDATVRAMIAESQTFAENKGLKINYYCTSAPVKITADESRVKDLIKNLIQNSILYTFKGGVNISLSRTADHVEFSVKDTGIGLTESDKSHLFQSGGRGEESVKYNTSSTGYGLFIAKKVVDNYKGHIFAESEGRDKGSKFTVILPIAQSLLK